MDRKGSSSTPMVTLSPCKANGFCFPQPAMLKVCRPPTSKLPPIKFHELWGRSYIFQQVCGYYP